MIDGKGGKISSSKSDNRKYDIEILCSWNHCIIFLASKGLPQSSVHSVFQNWILFSSFMPLLTKKKSWLDWQGGSKEHNEQKSQIALSVTHTSSSGCSAAKHKSGGTSTSGNNSFTSCQGQDHFKLCVLILRHYVLVLRCYKSVERGCRDGVRQKQNLPTAPAPSMCCSTNTHNKLWGLQTTQRCGSAAEQKLDQISPRYQP